MGSFRYLFACCAFASALCAAAPRPNIVVLVADDWGYMDVGAFGGEIATPHLDSLARRGVKFSNFHVAATCSPTRAMLMTGVDNHRNGVGNMPESMPAEHEGMPGYEGVLNDQSVTLATMLRDNGYHTYITGKWHLGKSAAQLPPQRGFDRSFIQADSGSDNWENRTYMMLYDKAYWYSDGKEATLPADFYSSRFFVDKAIEYIAGGAADSRPFFAYIGFQANHIPIQAPAEFVDKYRGKYDGGWTALRQARQASAVRLGLVPPTSAMVQMPNSQDWSRLSPQERSLQARRMEVYAGMAEAADFHIGRLIAHLKASGQFDNTIFVFLSDNGPDPANPFGIVPANLWVKAHYQTDTTPLGGKGTFSANGPSWASALAAPLSGYKYFASEGGLRVPLIISGVPGAPADRFVPALTTVKDIVPTLLELAGIPAHGASYRGAAVEPMDGRSLGALLKGTADTVYAAQDPVGYELSGSSALYKGRYKLVRNIAPVGDGTWHLYDLQTDPGEAHDLRDLLPDVVASLSADYAAYAQRNQVLPIPPGFDLQKAGLRYALNHYLRPKLLATLPYLVAATVFLAILVAVRVRRKRRRPSTPLSRN